MSIGYDKLWILFIDKKMNREELRKSLAISSTTLEHMGQDVNFSLEVLCRICKEINVI